MIKFLILFLTFCTLSGMEHLYRLPDHHTRFLHDLSVSMKKSDGKIIWITSIFNHAELKKNIIRLARNRPIFLVIHNLDGDPLSMVAYENVYLYHYPSQKRMDSLIIGDTFLCSLNTPLDSDYMSQKKSIVRCTENRNEIISIRRAITPILKNAHLYLK